ncbi:malto-oligosyltrehalose synthase [Skermania sp. ID1734]|uniref:malto-oligosyltrehalose synthase n=1 Tax=Skermania sp. ID1734 TaxID=2597516 RepID=UPI00117CB8C7|nr:malto-oligosyltrehalose synthase [Skermania sp. ID1734]TSE01240.1 malto-oligosyltrehalose synthase [Skermania sp. ID1734]
MATPSSTYRLQLRGDALTLDDAVELVDYLDRLGVTHLYLSPILTAADGSTHGYDVTDPTTVSAALGGLPGLRRLAAAAQQRQMGLIVDLVPNHLGVADPRQNPWWWDVLRLGRESPYAKYFDIDWRPENGADGRIALPFLGSADAVSELTIDRSGSEPLLAYWEHRFPLAPGTDTGSATEIHDRQHYVLVPWQAGIATYRRFFTVNELAAVRQEDPEVFEATHQQVETWVREALIDGLRIDHPDGLARPAEYLARLRELIGPDRWLVIEKILGADEPLDATLPIAGTTGYDALAELDGVFISRDGEAALTELSRERSGNPGDAATLESLERAAKRSMAESNLRPELRRLTAAVCREANFTGDSEALSDAIVAVVAAVPVYRTDYAPLTTLLRSVIADVQSSQPELGDVLGILTTALATNGEAFVRFQQVCGAVMAKAVEDTVFYRTARLVSLQEVGGEPGRFGLSVNEFHLANAARAQWWPAAMTTLSTHDTKRGEDVRARIGVLSQVPELWATCLAEWEQLAASPDPVTGLFLWQNIFGVWPVDGELSPTWRGRVHGFAEKAMREAGVRTSWQAPDTEFEQRVHDWLDSIVDGPVAASMTALVQQLAPHGWTVSLGQKLLQLCGPGVPDVYQGTELWDDSLVDPDNRRLVDFDARQRMLAEFTAAPDVDASGAAKLWVVTNALRLRRERRASFVGGSYHPIFADGPAAAHLVGFGRGPASQPADVMALATRHSVRLAESGWGTTVVDLGSPQWTDRLTGQTHTGRVALSEVFAKLPVALLEISR